MSATMGALTVALVLLLLLLNEANSQEIRLSCPNTIRKDSPFNVTAPTTIVIDKTSGVGSLCTLTLELENSLFIPIARSYDGNNWERAGGSFIASAPEWVCNGSTCTSVIPSGNNYVLATRSLSITTIAPAEVARFLESASFGATPNDVASWGDKSFAQHIKDQVNTPMTSHREMFRKLANPRWTFHKPEFGGRLDPCATNSTWRRQVLTLPDRRKTLNVRKVDNRWEVKIDGHVRTMVRQLRFVNAVQGQNDTIVDGGSYDICSSSEEIIRGIFEVRIGVNCRPLVSEDLMVDFPEGYIPQNSVQGLIPALGQNPQWKSISSRNPEYIFIGQITSVVQQSPAKSLRSVTAASETFGGLFCRPLFKLLFLGFLCRNDPPTLPPTPPPSPTAPVPVSSPGPSPIAPVPVSSPGPSPIAPVPVPSPGPSPTVSSSCLVVKTSSAINAPLFAKTSDGIWLQSDPRIDMKSNTVNEPLPDGGLGMLQAKKTLFCSNAARTFFNEGQCKMSDIPACLAGSTSSSASVTGAILCGSPSEIGNDLMFGDNWLDVSSISSDTSFALGLPADTTSSEMLSRQREFIWSEISLKSIDQLRQRVAFALLYIFSLPKMSIRGEAESTELFLFYYDIFVRNSFGNYGDVLEEISYNALNAESLSYVGSKSVAYSFAVTKSVVFPDENYARELMQLFTVGLFELNMDGTPVFSVNGTRQSYTSEDVLSFSKIWTAFQRNLKRANVESIQNDNRYDPMRLDASSRDRFPKSDLSKGYIGDFYPLCVDLPSKSFLRVGAKYRLLGTLQKPELKAQTWKVTQSTQTFKLAIGSNLYDRLCSVEETGACSYPSLVVLDGNLKCSGLECSIDTIHIVQIGSVFYEYVRPPCVELPFFMNGVKTAGQSRNTNTICANPSLPVASEACCLQNSVSKDAIRSCLISGETMTRDTAQSRCSMIGMTLCDFRIVNATEKCPYTGFHWTSGGCVMNVKVSRSGEVAIVHNFTSTISTLKRDSPSYFKVYWQNDQYPSVDNFCGGGRCEVFENTCICNITVTYEPVFVVSPINSAEILQQLRIGHPDPSTFDLYKYTSTTTSDFKTYTTSQTCCGTDTFFEVQDRNGQKRFLRNLKSTVGISGTLFNFRNPPQFNSVFTSEYSIADAHYETKAALDYLLYHQNTPPFVAYRLIQRFGVSNPTPRYNLAVATAFKTGSFTSQGITFGQGRYGDMEASIAAVLLDREARSVVLDKDPAHGSLREPILKVLSFMRATDFNSSAPLVELDLMEAKVGQMAYEQTSVFSFFRPEYSPSELSSTRLTAPESQAMSSTNIVGLMNGLYSLVKYGLNECNGGFGAFGSCSGQPNSGTLKYLPGNINVPTDMVQDLSYLLTGGRMSNAKQLAIVAEITKLSNATSRYQMALQLIASSPEFHSTNTMNSIQPPVKIPAPPTNTSPPTSGYKAVIHFFLRGGCDSFNVLVPTSSCVTLHEEYTKLRGLIGLTPAETIPLSGDASGTQPCSSFSIHSGLSTIQKLYNEQDLLFMANVGVLTQYVNRSDYSVRTKTPLFSHNSMQDEVAKLDPLKEAGGTGALGRMADVLQLKGYRTSRTAIDSPSSNLASRGTTTPPIVTMSSRGVSLFNVNPASASMRSVVVDQLNSGVCGIYGDLWSTLLQRSINQTEELFTILKNTPTKTIFPSTALGSRFKVAAQLIAAHTTRRVDRDVFFIPFDGFDTHDDVNATLQTRFLELNDALNNFVTELKLLGVWDSVAIVQSSDFGRTLTGNSGGGTDHGWGGNYWLAGGAVKGQRIVGQYPPTFRLEDYEFNIDRGRLIPTTSWDSIFNAIAAWMGLNDESDLRSVLPNREQFPDVFPASTLFSF